MGCYLDIGATLLTRGDIPFSSPFTGFEITNCTAGRCCLYRALLRAELPMSVANCMFVKGWVCYKLAAASRLPTNAPHRGAC